MTELMAKTPFDGLLPTEIGSVTCTEIVFDAITSLAPIPGAEAAVSDILKAQIGAPFPAPGRTTGKAHARAVWAGRGQVFVLGPRVAAIPGVAMTDQTDAWACAALEGAGAGDVLARLTPIDLRPGVFKRGHAARTLLGHMNAVVMRTGADRYGLMVFRSMARTFAHDVTLAMEAVAARG